MKFKEVRIVRVYITESSNLLDTLFSYLKEEAKISGVSVFRAIEGFGKTGELTASWVDLSLDLPLVVEFFDTKNKIEPVLTYLSTISKHVHFIFWDVKTND